MMLAKPLCASGGALGWFSIHRSSVIVLFACLVGCRMSRDFPAQPVRIVGMSYNPGVALQMIPPPEPGDDSVSKTATGRSISAWGEAEVPAMALDPLQGRLVARQMAKQAARRDLARKIEAMQVYPGRTIGDIIGDDPEKREEIEGLIREARQDGVIKSDRGKCSVFLTLDLDQLDKIVDLGRGSAKEATMFGVTAVLPEEFRRRAEREALDNARARALEFLKSLRLGESETLGERMLHDDVLDRAVRQNVATLRPTAPSFHEDGTCERAVVLDLADIQRLLTRRRFRLRLPGRLR